MRYSEHSFDRKIESPLDLIKFIFFSMTLAPIRLFMEISKKIIFLGDYFNTYLITALVLNVILIVVTTIYSVFISKRVYLWRGNVPLAALVVSFIIILLIFLYSSKYKFDVDLNLLNGDTSKKDRRETTHKSDIIDNNTSVELELGEVDLMDEEPASTSSSSLPPVIGSLNLDMLDNLTQELSEQKLYHSEKGVEEDMARKLRNIEQQASKADVYAAVKKAVEEPSTFYVVDENHDFDETELNEEEAHDFFVALPDRLKASMNEANPAFAALYETDEEIEFDI